MSRQINIKYKIIRKHPETHSIVVRYYSDHFTEEMLAAKDEEGRILLDKNGVIYQCQTDTNITLYDTGKVMTDEELHNFLMRWAPLRYFKLLMDIADPAVNTTMDALEAHEETEQLFEYDKFDDKFVKRNAFRKVKKDGTVITGPASHNPVNPNKPK